MAKPPVFEPLPKFPEEKRDLALVMDKDITCGQVEELHHGSRPVLTSRMLALFDVYEGRQIASR